MNPTYNCTNFKKWGTFTTFGILTLTLTGFGLETKTQAATYPPNLEQPFPQRANEDSEIVGYYLRAFCNPKENALEPLLGTAQTLTEFGGIETKRSQQHFLEIWKQEIRRIGAIETDRKGTLLLVKIEQAGPINNRTHRLIIDTATKPPHLKLICLETTSPETPSTRQSNDKQWISRSIDAAQSQFLAGLQSTTSVSQVGRTVFEEGPTLESVAFPLEANQELIGAAVIVRNKTTGETIVGTAYEARKTKGATTEFRRLRDKAAQTIAGAALLTTVENR